MAKAKMEATVGQRRRPLSAYVSAARAVCPPPGAIDTHVHVIDPARFPYARGVPYRPVGHEQGTAQNLAALLDAHGMAGVVLVNPTSGYKFDHRCMLDALERLGGRARGIARLPLTVSMRALAALKRQGVVGVRLDVVAEGLGLLVDPALERFLRRLCENDLLLDVQCEGDQMAALAPVLARTPLPVVVDHCGRPDPARGVRAPGFAALLRLSELGRVTVKLSGPMRASRQVAPYDDMLPFVRALIAAYGPDALVWGSDWPFLRCAERMDYGPLLALLERWVPSAADRRRVLCGTPARVFRF